MFRDVRYFGLAGRLGEESEMKHNRVAIVLPLLFLTSCLAILSAIPARAENLALPPEATQAMEKMYGGDPEAAIAIARNLEQSQPDSPLGFLLEGEAQWWRFYCAASEIRYGMVDAAKRGKKPEDEADFALADKVIHLAQAQIAKVDTAEMHVYAGMGYALDARLRGLRNEHRAVAHAGVAARAEFLRALELDPDMADATAGLGLYNYYVDSLSSMVKMLRFFMGIPGGNKAEGINQMRVGIERGILMRVTARYYLARNLRTYDQQYAEAVTLAEPLVAHYPKNPVFLLLLGNLNAELSRNAKAAEYFQHVLQLPPLESNCSGCASCPDCATCVERTRTIAQSFLDTLK
jgi:tetratricopeptide (TPR) repeat protein